MKGGLGNVDSKERLKGSKQRDTWETAGYNRKQEGRPSSWGPGTGNLTMVQPDQP